MEWIDLPLENRPQLILGEESCSRSENINMKLPAYEPSLDQAGHSDGPDSRTVNVVGFF
jgi:hypothetical protein